MFPEFATLFSDPFGRSARALLDRAATAAEFAEFDLNELTALLGSASRQRLGQAKAAAIQAAAADSLGMTALGPAARIELDAYLAQLTLLDQQVAAADVAIAAIMATLEHPLLTVPGIGPVLSASILAEIGDVSRFPHPDQLVAYAGLDPSVFASGQFSGSRAHISKRGSAYLRRALYLAAHSAIRSEPDLAAFHARKQAEGKHYTVALVATSNKLLHRIYAILRSGEPYRSPLPAEPAAEAAS